jgi:D-arabinose 1-dehydrogenase-like Zn-dependent alcohol dehydrogenase
VACQAASFWQFFIGHEFAGVINALGEGVDEYRVGDRVTVEAIKAAGNAELPDR